MALNLKNEEVERLASEVARMTGESKTDLVGWRAGPAADPGRGRRDPRLRPGRRMTLDSSVLIAILFEDSGYLDLVDRILTADHVRVGAPTLVETSMVFAGSRGAQAIAKVETLVRELGVTVVPFGERECCAAVAAVAKDSLMFLGNDFSNTYITAA